MSVRLTGGEELALRRLQQSLEVPPPLSNMLRLAVEEFVISRLRSDPKVRARYNALLENDRHLKLEP